MIQYFVILNEINLNIEKFNKNLRYNALLCCWVGFVLSKPLENTLYLISDCSKSFTRESEITKVTLLYKLCTISSAYRVPLLTVVGKRHLIRLGRNQLASFENFSLRNSILKNCNYIHWLQLELANEGRKKQFDSFWN